MAGGVAQKKRASYESKINSCFPFIHRFKASYRADTMVSK